MFRTDASRTSGYADILISPAAAAAYRISNDTILANLVIEDLDFIEKDLAFYEKVRHKCHQNQIPANKLTISLRKGVNFVPTIRSQ